MTLVSPHIIDSVKGATLTLTTESLYIWACMVDIIIALTENDGTLYRCLGTWPLMVALMQNDVTL